jgi:hypothetical protein
MSDEWPGQRLVMPTNLRVPSRVRKCTFRSPLATATLSLFVGLGVSLAALAQRTAEIKVASTIIAAPATQVPLPVQVGPPEAVPPNSFVRIRGLPPSVSLTEGHAIAPGSWAVPLFALLNLRANIPAGASGRTDFVITLLGADGAQIAEVRSALVIGTSALTAPVEKAPADPRVVSPPSPVPALRPQTAPRAAELPPQEKARAERLLAKGEEYFASGNIAAARDFFERAVEVGLAAAALRLAATYDPAELERAATKGIIADRNLARKWYERAREMGAPEAVERLARLNGS